MGKSRSNKGNYQGDRRPQAKQDEEASFLTLDGVVEECLPSAKFRVKLIDHDKEVKAHIAGRLRINRIRILVGDRVRLELSIIDMEQARIVYRYR